jgi:hypothetical protein
MPLIPSLVCALTVLGATVPSASIVKSNPGAGFVPAGIVAAAPSRATYATFDGQITGDIPDQILPRVAYVGSALLLVYVSYESDNDPDIDLIAVDPGVQSTFLDLTYSSLALEGTPDLAVNTVDQGALVVFEHCYGPTDYDLYAARIGMRPFSTASWLPITVSTAYDRAPAVAFDSGTDEYLVVWAAGYAEVASPQRDIHAQRMLADGSLAGSEFVIAANPEDEQTPSVAYDPVGRHYLVTWDRYVGSDHDVHGLLLDDAGNPSGSEFPITNWIGEERRPRLAANSRAGGFLVVFETLRGADTWDIRARTVSGAGVVGANVLVGGAAGNSRTRPALTYSAGPDEYEVVYEYAYSPGDHDIIGRRLHPDATPVTDEFTVTNLTSETLNPAVAGNVGDGYQVVWQDDRNESLSGWDIYGSFTSITVATPVSVTTGPLRLAPPRPNPARGPVELTVSGGEGPCRIEVLDVAGRLVRALDGGAGPVTRVRWDGAAADGARAAPGIYLVRATRGTERAVRRIVVVE